MSRVGQLPIPLPQGVAVDIDRNEVTVKGSKGELRRTFHPAMSIAVKDGSLVVSRPNDQKMYRALHGLTRSLLANMVEGVDKGFERFLEIVGVGYRVQSVGDKIVLQVGYTHTVEVSPLPGVSVTAEGANRVRVFGIDKEAVGEVAARIRRVHPPDVYKGKGIRYSGEQVRLKPGKAGRAVGKKK
ncbi:MAG: 50S ribosomal protein L6 [Dehalococcoidia bacterium]|nr:50S ribosomal protein L6 [Dehalococcoidia bacterium]